MSDDLKLPQDGWVALHQDGTLCLDWTTMGVTGQGLVPCLVFKAVAPRSVITCTEGGETLAWARCTAMAVNAAARLGGTARFTDDDDD
jgi:hypothetical protein